MTKIKQYIIIVNAREKNWLHKQISFEEVVVLAFGMVERVPTYTVHYRKGNENQPEGILLSGDSVNIKEGMQFNVTMTNRS